MRRLTLSVFCLGLLAILGCQQLNLMRFQSPDPDPEPDTEEVAEERTELIGEKAAIAGNNVIVIHGVGLVMGLENTGEDPPPSLYRTTLLDEMRRRGVKEPNRILQSPTTALVQITAYLPADIQKGDPFDVEVRLPGNTEATSLAGGWLMETRLSEKAMVPGQGELDGHDFGVARGPVLISTGEGDEGSLAGVLRRGKILAGGVALKERNLGLYIRNEYRSFRNSKRIATRIGQRFHYYEQGLKRPMAEAKTDQYVELKVHPRYKENYPRYIQVVRSIAFRESSVEQRDRMEQLKQRLAVPSTSARAAVELEAIGNDAVPILKTGLKNSKVEVQFYAAEALAYLGEEAGAEHLYHAARDERAFRVYALAALAALDESSSFQYLRELLEEQSAETRYGAFRALWTLDKDDPFIRGRRLNDQFNFHIIDSEQEPMIHLTRNRIAEVVLFGADQQFRVPLAFSAGSHINVNAQAGSDTISVTRFQVGQPDQRKVVSTRVADVIVAVAELGATYPEVAQMLTQAENQGNAPGRIEIDALPQAGRLYYRPVEGNTKGPRKARRVGRASMNPNLFPAVSGPEQPGDIPADVRDEQSEPGDEVDEGVDSEEVNEEESLKSGDASLTDVGGIPPPQKKRKFRFQDLFSTGRASAEEEIDLE